MVFGYEMKQGPSGEKREQTSFPVLPKIKIDTLSGGFWSEFPELCDLWSNCGLDCETAIFSEDITVSLPHQLTSANAQRLLVDLLPCKQ